jgi:23S rRNA pseudouridine1911/1915/1917 synthase
MIEDDEDGLDDAVNPDRAAAGGDATMRASVQVPPESSGLRLDQALAGLFPELSRSRLQRWVKAKQVTVDGVPARPRDRVLGGERIEIDAVLEADARWTPQEMPLEVVHEDADLIIIDKPAGLVVHPGAGNPDRTLVNGLLHRYPELARVPRAGIVHRLDKDTSGLLAVARSLEAHASLVAQLADRSMGRGYLAVVEGVPTGGFTVDAPIARDPHNRLRMAVVESGRDAVTRVRVEARYRAHALLACRLQTGRTHQIRVHLRHMGHSIVGDPLYGARGRLPTTPSADLVAAVRGFRRQALHARSLALIHPRDGTRSRFEAPVAEDLAGLIHALEADAALAEER